MRGWRWELDGVDRKEHRTFQALAVQFGELGLHPPLFVNFRNLVLQLLEGFVAIYQTVYAVLSNSSRKIS